MLVLLFLFSFFLLCLSRVASCLLSDVLFSQFELFCCSGCRQ